MSEQLIQKIFWMEQLRVLILGPDQLPLTGWMTVVYLTEYLPFHQVE